MEPPTTSNFGLIELSLVFGSLMIFLIWELVSLKRSQRRDAEKEAEEERRRGNKDQDADPG